MTVLVGDCRALMPPRGPFDMILADPPYGDTSPAWARAAARIAAVLPFNGGGSQ